MKIKFFLIALAIFLIGVASIFLFYGWFLQKQERVLAGTARSEFPYKDYSIEELNKMYPQYANENVKTTQTPEETHAKLIAALKKEDFAEAARCCFREGDWEKMQAGFEKIKKEGQLGQMIKDLDTKIIPNVTGDTKSSYEYSVYRNGKEYASGLTFIKNSQGVWLIESL